MTADIIPWPSANLHPMLQCSCGCVTFKCYIDTSVLCAECDGQIAGAEFFYNPGPNPPEKAS